MSNCVGASLNMNWKAALVTVLSFVAVLFVLLVKIMPVRGKRNNIIEFLSITENEITKLKLSVPKILGQGSLIFDKP